MTGRFNQDLPENLHTAFEKAVNFEPCIITKQSINERKVHDTNHIDVTPCQDEIEINEAHIRNPNYKGNSAIILATQETTTKTMETKEITIQRATIRRNQSTYQLC